MKEMRGIHKLNWLVPSAARCAALAVALGITTAAQADNAAVTVAVSGTTVTASNASAADYDNYTWHKSAYTTLKLKVPASADLAEGTYVRLTSLSIGAQNGGSGNYNNQVKYLAVTGVDGFSYKSAVISTTASGFSSSAATPETSDKQTFALADPWCFLVVGTEYAVDLLDENGSSVAGLSARCVEYTDSVLSNWNGAQWTPLAELTAEIVTPTTPAAVDEAGDYTIALDGLATYPSISVAGNLTITGSGTLVVTGAFTLGGTLTADSTVNLAFQSTTSKSVSFPAGTAFYGLRANSAALYVTGSFETDDLLFSYTSGTLTKPTNHRINTAVKDNTDISYVTVNGVTTWTAGWKLYWAGAENAYMKVKTNWRFENGDTPEGFPNDGSLVGDHLIFPSAASVKIGSSSNALLANIVTVSAPITISNDNATNPLRVRSLIEGETITLGGNAYIQTAGAPLTIENDLVISGTESAPVLFNINASSCNITLEGDITGSGYMACSVVKGNNYAGMLFYGDMREFAGYMTLSQNNNNRHNYAFCGQYSWSEKAHFTMYPGNENWLHNPSTVFKFGSFKGGAVVANQSNYQNCEFEIGKLGEDDDTISGTYFPTSYQNLIGSRGQTMRKVGTGTLTSTAKNLKKMEIAGGTLVIDGNGCLSVSSYGNVPVSFTGDGGILKLTSNVTDVTDVSANIQTSSGMIGYDTDSRNQTWANAITGTGGFTKKGAGTLTLTAIPQYSGATRVEEGTLVVPLGTSLGDVYVAEDATLTVDLTGATSSSAFLTCASMENNGTVNWINAPDGITPKAVEIDGKYFIAVPRTLTWRSAGDDTAWTTAGNWLVGEDAATLAPQPFDSVLFNTTTPGVTLSAAAEVASVTAPNGLTLATAYDLTVYGDFTVTGAFTKEGKGTLTIEGAFSATDGTTVASGAIDANLETAQVVTLNGGSAYDDCENDTANGYGAKFITPNADLLTLSGAGAVSAEDTLAVTSGSFTGSLTGGMGLSKSGDGTFTLFGNNTFTGDVTVSGGTLKLATPLDLSDVRHDFDSSVATSFSYADEEAGTISVWNDVSGNGGVLTVDTDNNAAYATYESTLFSGNGGLTSMAFRMKKTSSFTTLPYTAFFVVQNGSSSQTQNIAGDSEDARWNIRFRNNGYMKGYGKGGSTTWTSAGIWGNGTLATQGGGSSTGNNGGYNPGANATVLTFVGPMSDNYDWVRGASSHNEYIGGSSDQNWAEYLTYKRQFTFDEKAAVEQYLMAKWGINSATYAALPATADVTVAAGATLDLGGQTVTVASLNLSGTIQNGTLVVPANSLSIANATAAIIATIKVTNYVSSMVAPTGYKFSDNGDGTATLIAVYSWTDGTGDHSWGSAGNWDKNAVPGENDVVAFPSENAPEGGWTVYVGQGTQTCLSMTLNADVTLSLNASQSDWSGINVKGSIEGSGKLILWRSGVNNFAANPVTISCPLVVKANGSDSFLQKVGFNVTGAVEVNSLFVVYDVTEFSGAVTLNNGAVVRSSASWYNSGAEAPLTFSGTIAVPSDAAVSFDRSSQTITGAVTMGAGSTFTLSSATTATAATFTLGDGAKLVVPTGASVTAANITSAAGGDTIASYTSGTDTVYVNNTIATWIGGATGGWNTGSNWSTGVTPQDGTAVTFGAIAADAGYSKYTVGVSANGWDPWVDRDKCKSMVLNAPVTLANVGSATGGYLAVYGDITGDENASLTLNSVGLDNASWNPAATVNVTCPFYVDGSSANACWFAARDVGFNITEAGVYALLNMYCPVTVGTLTIGNNAWLNIGANRTMAVTTLVVADGATATISPDEATSTLTAPSPVSQTPQYSVTTSTSGLNVTYTSSLTGVVPGASTVFTDETAANNASVVLTSAQTAQGLETNYYKKEVYESDGSWYVRAVLDDSVVGVDLGEEATAAVSDSAVTITVTNLKPGLCYRIVSGSSADGMTTVGAWSEYYNGSNAPTLSAALPDSGVMYYSVEASDTK